MTWSPCLVTPRFYDKDVAIQWFPPHCARKAELLLCTSIITLHICVKRLDATFKNKSCTETPWEPSKLDETRTIDMRAGIEATEARVAGAESVGSPHLCRV